MKIRIISYNVASESQLSGLSQLLSVQKPSLVFLQEVTVSTAQLISLIGSSYTGLCNTDELNPNKPGTAIVWLKDLAAEVINIVTCRVQLLKIWNYQFLNIYGYPGT